MQEPSLSSKVAFLSDARTYGSLQQKPVVLETHMSWVFLAGDRAFKLKKPVRFTYLDYSTLSRRESACRTEAKLNRRLAPSVYLGVAPLRLDDGRYSINGRGTVADWLVVMRRLDSRLLLDRAIYDRTVNAEKIDRAATALAKFYRTADRVMPAPELHKKNWRENIATNRNVLLRADLGISRAPLWRIDRVQRRLLAGFPMLFEQRIRKGKIVDGHGDLRPEHICLDDPPQIIDCLEFSRVLRTIDPLDEIAFLSVECERLGAAWIGDRVLKIISRGLHDDAPEPLYRFYRCYRATLRARLTIAHLLEPDPRTPEKWAGVAREYLRIAQREAIWLERWLDSRVTSAATSSS